MVLDNILTRILNQVREEVKVKFKVDYTLEQIHEIVDTQIEATKMGFAKSLTVHWTGIGKFVFTAQDKRNKKIKEFHATIDTTRFDLSLSERERLKRDYIIQQAEEKQALKKSKTSTPVGISVKEVLEIESCKTPSLLMFKAISKRNK